LQRADFYLRSGKPGEARVMLEQAAQLGSGVAALTLGAMYDPGRTTQFSNLELKADPTVARAWYLRAKDLGVAEANDRLAELAAR
jgi:TPR repeat protein